MRVLAGLYAIFSCAAVVFAQGGKAPDGSDISLVGTWASGAGNVLTGLNDDGTGFYNPMRKKFTVPKTAGISYSFTDDNKFEEAQYFYSSNRAFGLKTLYLYTAKDPHCFSVTLLWQHGTYKLEGKTNLTITPYQGDGAVQTMGTCDDPPRKLSYYAQKEYFGNWTLSVDADPVFFSAKSAYALNLYRNTGEPLAKMYKRFDPPRMLPTEPLLKHVIGSPN